MRPFAFRSPFDDSVAYWDLLKWPPVPPEDCPVALLHHCGIIDCDWCEPHQCGFCAPEDVYPYHDLDLILDPKLIDPHWKPRILPRDELEVSSDAGYEDISELVTSSHNHAEERESEFRDILARERKADFTRPQELGHEYEEPESWYESRMMQEIDSAQRKKHNQEDGDLGAWYELDIDDHEYLQPDAQDEEKRADQDETSLVQPAIENSEGWVWDWDLRHGKANVADTGLVSSYRAAEEEQPQQQINREETTSRQHETPVQPPLSSCSKCEEPDYKETLVGCDDCDAWFHISCVFLAVAPQEEEHWECPDCFARRQKRKKAQGSSNQRPKKARVSKNHSSSQEGRKEDWTPQEKNLVTELMREVIAEKICHQTEKKWEVISNRLSARYNLHRKPGSIKNKWGRELRAESGIDERVIENPDKMTTSRESQEKRRAARQKRKQATKHDDGSLSGASSPQAPMFSPMASNSHVDVEPIRSTMGGSSGQYDEGMVREPCSSLNDQAPMRSSEVQELSMPASKRKRPSSGHDHRINKYDGLLPDQDPGTKKRQRHAHS